MFEYVQQQTAKLKTSPGGGGLREDLPSKRRVISITLPPLRARTEDIVSLALSFPGSCTSGAVAIGEECCAYGEVRYAAGAVTRR